MALFPDASPQYKARLLASDVKALDAMRVDSLGSADVLPKMTMPCLVYAGSAAPIYPAVEETIAENAECYLLQFAEPRIIPLRM